MSFWVSKTCICLLKLICYLDSLREVSQYSFSWSIFSCIRTEYEPEKIPYLDTFHSLILFQAIWGWNPLSESTMKITRERSIPPEHRIQDVIWTCLCTFNLLLCPRGRATSLLLTLKRYLLLELPPSFFVFIDSRVVFRALSNTYELLFLGEQFKAFS